MLTPMADDADATLAVRSTTAGDVTTTLSVYDTICRSPGWGAPGVPEYIVSVLAALASPGIAVLSPDGTQLAVVLCIIRIILYFVLYYILYCGTLECGKI